MLLAERASQFKPAQVKRTEKNLAKARTRDSMSSYTKLTEVVDGEARIVDQSPLIVPLSQLAPGGERDALLETLRGLVRVYRESLDYEGGSCSSSSASPISLARWSVSGASARGPGSRCSSAAMATTLCSCR